MKRLPSLFSLFLILLGTITMYAQTPTASPITEAEVPTGYYFIASTEASAYDIASPYIAANGTGAMQLVAQSAVTTDFITSKVGIWYIQKTGTTSNNNKASYSIKSVENNMYWASGPNCPLGSSAGVYNIIQDASTSSYYFSGNGGGISNNAYVNATSATVFGRNNSGSYNKWKLIPAGIKDITLNYTAGSHTFSITKTAIKGKTLSTADNWDFYSEFNPSTITVGDADTYNVTCTAAFPFEAGKFYKLKLRSKDKTKNTNNTLETGSANEYKYRTVIWDGESASKITTRNALTDANTGLWKFEFVEGTANQVYLCNAVGNRVFIANANDGTKAGMTGAPGAATPFVCETANTNYTNGFRLAAVSNDRANLNDIDGELGYWTPNSGNLDNSKTDGGSTFIVIEPTTVPVAVSKLHATNTATNQSISIEGMKDTYAISGTTGNKIPHNAFFTIDASATTFDGTTLNINYTSTAPYLISGTTEDSRYWQGIRSRNENFLKLSGENVQSNYTDVTRSSLSSIRTFNTADNAQWAIVPAGGLEKFYLVNKSNNKKAYLAAETQGTLVTIQDEGTPFYLAPQPANFTDLTGGFTIQPNNTNSHAVGDHCEGKLGYWSNRGSSELNDVGSIFHADLVADCNAIIAAETDLVGSISADPRATLATQLTVTDFFTKFDELKSNADFYTKPIAGAIYRIRANRYGSNDVFAAFTNATANAEGVINSGSGNTPSERELTFTSSETPSAYVRFIPQDDYYLIQDVNSQYYYGSRGDNNHLYLVQNSEYAGHYTIENTINGTIARVGLKENRATDITQQYLWCRADDANSAISTYPMEFHSPYTGNATIGNESSVEPGCVYQIKHITAYPLTITEAGYASLCLPFSVSLPENIKAYKVTGVEDGENRAMTMAELTSPIAAGEPIILQATAGDYNLTIHSDNGTKESDNILTGTTAKRTDISDIYYALGYKALNAENAEEKTAGFYKVTTTRMPANKAYLLKDRIPANSQNAALFLFNFEGNTTTAVSAVSAINSNCSDNVYYDLNGRRVLYPTHGIYVKSNGQKVFFQ